MFIASAIVCPESEHPLYLYYSIRKNKNQYNATSSRFSGVKSRFWLLRCQPVRQDDGFRDEKPAS